MIALISRWKLKDGCLPELVDALQDVAGKVRDHEPDTWMYLVNLPAYSPLDGDGVPLDPAPPPIPMDKQQEVVFIEIYRDARAFSYHVNGPTFTAFRTANSAYFCEDPGKPGWPLTDTQFLNRQSAFIRPQSG